MSTVPRWRPDQFGNIFIFRSKFFFPISQFLNVAQERVRCQRIPYGALICLGPFSFLVEIFFFNISISEYLTEASEVSTVPTRRPEQFATIFIFRSKFFFLTSQFLEG